MSLANSAYIFADHAHRGQKRRGARGAPYILHPIRVAQMVEAAGGDEIAQAAAYLHDVLEDTDATFAAIEGQFGGSVAEIVADVTRPAGMTSKTYWRHLLGLAPRMSEAARLIKVADAVDNVRDLTRDPTIWGPKRARDYLEAKTALVAAIGEPWPGLVEQFDAEASKVRIALGLSGAAA
jgi:(p)ppGpp synthase/HD superfamily hydrolase